MQAGLRAWINLANGSTLAGLGVAALGGARVARSADRLVVGTGYRLPVPPAPAFCLGNVIVTRLDGLDPASALFRHEARHATQYACCGGLVMVPLYLAAARAHREHSQQKLGLPVPSSETASVSPWAIVTDDLPGLNGHNPEQS